MLNGTQPERNSNSALRAYVAVSVLLFLCAGAYLGWTFYSRWEANQTINERAAAAQAERERSTDAKEFEAMGGNRFAILSFMARPASVSAGERASLCYSVSNAKSVKLEPPSKNPVWPAYERCVDVSPQKTTKYTLTIQDGAGHTKSATVEVKVR